jgi:hypothetical protein
MRVGIIIIFIIDLTYLIIYFIYSIDTLVRTIRMKFPTHNQVISSLVASLLSVVSLAGMVKALDTKDLDAYMTKRPQPQCFVINQKAKALKVNLLLTKEQKELFTRIKITEQGYDSLRLSYSLENNILKCLKEGKSISGSFQPTNSGIVYDPNNNTTFYEAKFGTYELKDGSNTKIIKRSLHLSVNIKKDKKGNPVYTVNIVEVQPAN